MKSFMFEVIFGFLFSLLVLIIFESFSFLIGIHCPEFFEGWMCCLVYIYAVDYFKGLEEKKEKDKK